MTTNRKIYESKETMKFFEMMFYTPSLLQILRVHTSKREPFSRGGRIKSGQAKLLLNLEQFTTTKPGRFLEAK